MLLVTDPLQGVALVSALYFKHFWAVWALSFEIDSGFLVFSRLSRSNENASWWMHRDVKIFLWLATLLTNCFKDGDGGVPWARLQSIVGGSAIVLMLESLAYVTEWQAGDRERMNTKVRLEVEMLVLASYIIAICTYATCH